MALDAPLNSRQLEVLQWIGDGCPDGRWSDFTFKTTAGALASRRLAAVSKRGGVWSAGLLPAGEYYLANDRYPKDHWSKRRRHEPTAQTETPVRPPASPSRPVSPPSAEGIGDAAAARRTPVPPGGKAKQLVDEVIAVGGVLRRESKQGPGVFSSLVAAANRHKLAPAGKQLTIEPGGRWESCVIRLVDAPKWLTTPAAEVVEAVRIDRWHPALRTIREGKVLTASVTAEYRMLRLLQAVATEAEARGLKVEAVKPRYRYHHLQSEAAHIAIKVRDHRYIVAVWQKFQEAARPQPVYYGATPKRPPSQDHEPLGIGIRTGTDEQSHRVESWSDSQKLRTRVEDVLPTLMWEIERRAQQEDERREARRLAEIEAARMREEAERVASLLHVENVRAEVLRRQHQAWREASELREFLVALSDATAQIGDDTDRAAATEWLDWCQEYVDSTVDPTAGRLAMPEIRKPTWEERSALVNVTLRRMERGKARGLPFPYLQ